MFGKKRKKSSNDVKDLIKKAYALGYEVGYYKHYEYIGWVRKIWNEIEEKASAAGIEEEIKKAYARGKADGERKRSLDLLKEEKIVPEKKNMPTTGIRAISRITREPRFFSLPSFLKRRNQR